MPKEQLKIQNKKKQNKKKKKGKPVPGGGGPKGTYTPYRD